MRLPLGRLIVPAMARRLAPAYSAVLTSSRWFVGTFSICANHEHTAAGIGLHCFKGRWGMRGRRAGMGAGLIKNREFDLLPLGSADTRGPYVTRTDRDVTP